MWFNPWYPFHPQDLRGNPSLLSVVAANATADTLGLLILPLLVWLYVAYCMEQSERSSVFPGWMFKFHIPETCQWLSMLLVQWVPFPVYQVYAALTRIRAFSSHGLLSPPISSWMWLRRFIWRCLPLAQWLVSPSLGVAVGKVYEFSGVDLGSWLNINT